MSCSARRGSFPRHTNPGSRSNGHFQWGISIRAPRSSAPGRLTGSGCGQSPPPNVCRLAWKRRWISRGESWQLACERDGNRRRRPRAARGRSGDWDISVQVPEADSWLSDPTESESQVAEAELSAVAELSGNAAIRDRQSSQTAQLGEPLIERRSTPARSDSRTATASAEVIEEEDSARRLVGLDERETLPDWYRADLPRICRTCRDYRPAADGQRGWCANAWAFTHRRLVLEDDPAPASRPLATGGCLSTTSGSSPRMCRRMGVRPHSSIA